MSEPSATTVLVIGGGGREHSITHKLVQSCHVGKIYASPGNAGIALLPKTKCISLDLDNNEAICSFCKRSHVDLVVIGPETYLESGLVDLLTCQGVNCFGPMNACAMLESNKSFAKKVMVELGIPTARFRVFQNEAEAKDHIANCDYKAWVVKAVGLTGGKGVQVSRSAQEACTAVTSFLKERVHGDAGSEIIIEELLFGQEISALCFTDGETVEMMPLVQDYKRLELGNRGPNTGGMGATCPYLKLSAQETKFIEEEIMLKVVQHMKCKGSTYKGVLYAGLMKTDTSIVVLEFNCRFGDPEAEVLMPLLQSDLYEIMQCCISGDLSECPISWRHDLYTLGVVMASEGYPKRFRTGFPIRGLNEADSGTPRAVVYHCDTTLNDDGQVVTNGGRVLCIVGSGVHPSAAKLMAYSTLSCIDFEGCIFRRDIGRTTSNRSLQGIHSNLASVDVYLEAGVDLNVAHELQTIIEPLCRQSCRPGSENSSIGGFGALFDLASAGYRQPLVISGADGVGTKLKVAVQCGRYETVGTDLVAMSVNDILTHNAEPLFFLDYIAVSAIDFTKLDHIVRGIVDGCKEANCALIGGETAELPAMYTEGNFDLAGFAVGALEKGRDLYLPITEKIAEGDVVIGLASSGIHSNGFSLIRKILDVMNANLNGPAPWNHDIDFGSALLIPTKIYVKSVLPVLRSGKVKAAVHITGGGLVGNVPRVLPSQLCVVLDAQSWPIPDEFHWIATAGNVTPEEMVRVFNCGIGMVLIVGNGDVDSVMADLEGRGESCYEIGKVFRVNSGASEPQVRIRNLEGAFSKSSIVETKMIWSISKMKRVAVMISGEGTNMLALISHSKQHCSFYHVVLVISNKKDAAGLAKAREMGISAQFVAASRNKNGSFENDLQQLLTEYNVELICLAGFMQILSGCFVRKWVGRILNVHPALLPSFKGLNPHRQALEAGVRLSGATVHFVEEEVDSGGIIAQQSVPVYSADSEVTLSDRIKQIEHAIYPVAVDNVARGFVCRKSPGKVCWAC
uniref:Trifunctional purine biosynthetic protein adenosine-3 n=1 Tax=Trichuris muris TaxID=70415 RepID=A0A5S6Q7G8_TRIMR